MLISFIIPHKGREEMLKKTVTSILAQDYDLSKTDITIVTQNKTLTFGLNQKKNQVPINILIRPENETISTLRNIGAKYSTGDYLAFLDADIELSSNWISAMLSELTKEPTRVLVSAIQRCKNNAPPTEKIRTALSNTNTDCGVQSLPGANIFLKKEVFLKIGGFPEYLTTCEDIFFSSQASQLGQLYYSSKTNFIHLGEDKTFKELFKKEIWRGQSNLQSAKGRPIPLSELPSFLVPVWVLLFTISTLVSFIFISIEYAILNFSLLILPILLYTTRLYKHSHQEISFTMTALFYLVYFPARAIGTILGLFKIIKTRV